MVKSDSASTSPRVWLLVRGLSRGSGHWGYFLRLFQKRFAEDKIILIDLPGNGEEFQLKSPWSITANMKFVREKFFAQVPVVASSENSGDDFRRRVRLNVVAVSMGGMVAVDWMTHFPGEIKKAFLINTSAGNLSPFYERFSPQVMKKVPQILLSANRELEILKFTSNRKDLSHTQIEELCEYSMNHPVSPNNFARQIFAASRSKFPRSAPGGVVLFNSIEDRLVSRKCSEAIAKEWQVPVIIHPTAGHDLPLDEPQWLLHQIEENL